MSIHKGGRALMAVVRPAPQKIAGIPSHLEFNYVTHKFVFRFSSHTVPRQKLQWDICAVSEFFIPNLHYPEGYNVKVSDGKYVKVPRLQILLYQHSAECHHTKSLFPLLRKYQISFQFHQKK